jgi:Domain of unknown function (DUF4184)
MPMTLPTHPIAVVPLKLWRPRWFDGVALVIGAMAPDFAYAEDGYGLTIHSHAWHAPLWWALPLTLLLAPVVRWAAPTIVAHLPAGGPLALRDYGVLARVHHRLHVTAVSAMLGAVTHIVWDAFAHPRVDGRRVVFPVLQDDVWSGLPVWHLVELVSDLAGFVVGTLLIVHIGRQRLLRRWHGDPPAEIPHPAVFWPVVGVVFAAGAALLPIQPVRMLHDQAMRLILVGALALLAGSIAVRTLRASPARAD